MAKLVAVEVFTYYFWFLKRLPLIKPNYYHEKIRIPCNSNHFISILQPRSNAGRSSQSSLQRLQKR